MKFLIPISDKEVIQKFTVKYLSKVLEVSEEELSKRINEVISISVIIDAVGPKYLIDVKDRKIDRYIEDKVSNEKDPEYQVFKKLVEKYRIG